MSPTDIIMRSPGCNKFGTLQPTNPTKWNAHPGLMSHLRDALE
jgi:hypothetical protein